MCVYILITVLMPVVLRCFAELQRKSFVERGQPPKQSRELFHLPEFGVTVTVL